LNKKVISPKPKGFNRACPPPGKEAVSEDHWRLTPPINILNESPFFDFASQNQKMGFHSIFYFAAGGERLLRQAHNIFNECLFCNCLAPLAAACCLFSGKCGRWHAQARRFQCGAQRTGNF
jgi:hypothetical protein